MKVQIYISILWRSLQPELYPHYTVGHKNVPRNLSISYAKC